MRFDEIKRGFWGYKKESVCRYIAQLEAEAKAKREEEVHQAEETSQKRVFELEEALRTVQEENEALRAQQDSISDALIQAQKYAQQIREQADEFEREAQERVQAKVDRQLQALEEYSAAADVLKEQLHALLKDTLGKTEDIQRELNILHDKGPDAELVGATPDLDAGIGQTLQG